ncbi:TPA: D-glycero-beta-D-manno-heptose-7-phosphate kinase [Candidatus Sumerlaeota bacterium]|nr:D-glycero-beta-D-manno-heptose-7-phosphate kinase [Candidatus Sumerlaeota bacterium]
MPTLQEIAATGFKTFGRQTILVIGDLMLDHYLWGSVERTTPEAPVPIVRHDSDSWIPGGAANVARNICSLGGKALLVGAVGADKDAKVLRDLLKESGIDTRGILEDKARPTTLKTRVTSMGQQLLRIDRESAAALSGAEEKNLIAFAKNAIPKCGAVVLSDYGKGVLTRSVIETAIEAAHAAGIPVLVDPKGTDYSKYRNADVLTPNQKETAVATAMPVGTSEELERAGKSIQSVCKLQRGLVITRGAEGVMVLQARKKPIAIPAQAREVFDVTGAGDSFIATLALGLASQLDLETAAELANHAGGVVVAKLGVATVSPRELGAALNAENSSAKIRPVAELRQIVATEQSRGRRVVFTNGCFDLLHAGHIRFLHEARRQGDLLIVGINTDRSIRALKGPKRPLLAEDERAALLAALEAVDYVVVYDELTPVNILRALHPDVLVKGGNLSEEEIVGREIVLGYGGHIYRVPMQVGSIDNDLVDSILGKA